ncbi:MAG: ATP-grasp domain-containing protein [Planctomycetota bacterium]|nr:ATP-grasp domain-containing protein [Planctomycetota bacterium]
MQAPSTPVPTSESLLILGASARAAAWSAQRAGYEPLAADMFGDRDLAVCRQTRLVRDYPCGLERAARSFPDAPWMYTGAIENQPALVDRIAAHRTLYGNRGAVLRRVRDPFQVEAALQAAGLPVPEVARSGATCGSGTWLCKPFHSCGGDRITRFEVGPKVPQEEASEARAEPRAAHDSTSVSPSQLGVSANYYQRFIAGAGVCGAVFVAAAGRAVLLGTTHQWAGTHWAGAGGFRYSGSGGPQKLDPSIEASLRLVGDCLASSFALTGLFGVDAIIADQTVWPVEVNPRYTASVEILERALGVQAIRIHVHACCWGELPATQPATPICHCGKQIIYARRDIRIPPEFNVLADEANAGSVWPSVADIPAVGVQIARNQPVVTVLADGANLAVVVRQLRQRVKQVQELLRC